MISEIEVQHFQSLRSLRVRLGWFTVLTGPSSTGKSGFLRAVRLVAFNARGTSFITRGEKACRVTMRGEDDELARPDEDVIRSRQWQVTINRGTKDSYQVGRGQELVPDSYTKLAGKVPEPVVAVLRLDAINFAGQFDPPYLLDATGGDVARVLGRLTNVTLLQKAAQEANRRRLRAASDLRVRKEDVEELTRQAEQYATLPAEGQAVAGAEEALGRLRDRTRERERLDLLITSWELAVTRLELHRVVPEPPSLAPLEEANGRLLRFRHLTDVLDNCNRAVQSAVIQERDAVAALHRATVALEEYQAQWGLCPLCGNPIRKEQS